MDKARIVGLCKSGDKKAFGLLYQAYLPAMRKVVGRYVQNDDAAWDVLHDGFLAAFSSIHTLKNADKVEAWLSTIMRNLSLQYLREESNSLTVPWSEISAEDSGIDHSGEQKELTLEELIAIIDKLPTGYGRVFRLAVLDGLSHKEIGDLLGIAPHSSSSQLTHAKAMLRRMIAKYRTEMGLLSVVGIVSLICYWSLRNRDDSESVLKIGKNIEGNGVIVSDTTDTGADGAIDNDGAGPVAPRIVDVPMRNLVTDAVNPDSSAPDTLAEPQSGDSIISLRRMMDNMNRGEYIAAEAIKRKRVHEKSDWSLSLSYSGNFDRHDLSRYMIPNPEFPDVEGPADVIEVTEKARHYMPLVIGISLNKAISPRWSVETGLRYSLLRSDLISEYSLPHLNTRTSQRIDYLGVPLKFSYRVFSYGGFSMYGHGGGALDIPIYGGLRVWKSSLESVGENPSESRIHAPLQWSVEGGIGIQYNFTPSLSIYAEPSLRYYFDTGSDIRTIRQEKPFEFAVPIGLRLTW